MTDILTRRSVVAGLFAAPAILKLGLWMPVRSRKPNIAVGPFKLIMPDHIHIGVTIENGVNAEEAALWVQKSIEASICELLFSGKYPSNDFRAPQHLYGLVDRVETITFNVPV